MRVLRAERSRQLLLLLPAHDFHGTQSLEMMGFRSLAYRCHTSFSVTVNRRSIHPLNCRYSDTQSSIRESKSVGSTASHIEVFLYTLYPPSSMLVLHAVL